MRTLPQYLRYSMRLLVKNPGFTAVALVTLALGIGANTAIFSLVRAALLTPLAMPHPERAVVVTTEMTSRDLHHVPSSVPDYESWKASGAFEWLGVYDDNGFNLRRGARTERVLGLTVTPEALAVLGAVPQRGRLINAQDIEQRSHVVMLSDQFWRRRLGGDAGIVGQSIVLDGEPYTVIGVMPRSIPRFGQEQIYAPLEIQTETAGNRGERHLNLLGSLAPNMTLEGARRRLDEVSRRLERDYPNSNTGVRAAIRPLADEFLGDVKIMVLVIFGAVGFVLLIACANLANLLLARGIGREKEIAVRAALGASRSMLARQLLVESGVLAVLGGLLGIVPAFWGVDLIGSFHIDGMPNPDLLRVDTTVLIFNIALSVATGILFGLAPAWQVSRTDVNQVLKTVRGGSRSHQRLRAIFVVSEVALTMVLLAGAGLMLESFLRLRAAWPGYNAHGVATLRITLSGHAYDAKAKQIAYFEEVQRRLRALPGVISAGVCDELPTSDDVHGSGLYVNGRPQPKLEDIPLVIVDSANADYFHTMQIPLVEGRLFADADSASAPPVVIVDAVTARHNWPNQSPVGQYIRFQKTGPPHQVVGVVGPVEHSIVLAILKHDVGQVYLAAAQAPKPFMSIALRAAGDPAAILPEAVKIARAVDPDQPVYQARTLDQVRIASRAPQSLATLLLGGFALTALLLAAVGIYGVVAGGVSRRMREIGIRIALGASQRQILGQVLGEGLKLSLTGLAIGLVGALALTRLMATLLYGVKPGDPGALAGVGLLLAATAVLASYVPARRALKADPARSLRYD